MGTLIEALPQYGLAGVMLGLLSWLLWKVGMRIVAALDRLIDKIEVHTKDDVERHGVVMARLEGMEVRIDTALDLTPVRQQRPKTNPHGVPSGYYSPRKPTVKDDD